MKALAIYPEYPATFWSFKYVLRFQSRKAAFPPLGLLTVASMFPADWEVKLVDMNVERLKDSDINDADIIFISAMIVQKESVKKVIEICQNFGKPIVAGGPLFTTGHQEFIDDIDYFVLGEAEVTFPQFLADYRKGSPKKLYQPDKYPSLQETPLPRWDLIDHRKYGSLLIQNSRGCPFDCEFCDIPVLFGHKPRLKTPDQFIDELEAIYKTGWAGSLFVVDDNFIGNRKIVKETLRKTIDWSKNHNYPFDFLTEVSINLVDDKELMELMVEAGFSCVFVGIETPNESSLKECGKNQNLARDLTESIRQIQKAGLQVYGGYIVGFDGDDASIFDRMIQFIQESGVVTAMVGLLNVLPKTRLWERLNKEGRLLGESSGNNLDTVVNFTPVMDMQTLIDGYKKIIYTIYQPKNYYHRIRNFLKNYRPAHKGRVSWGEVKAFFRSIFWIGILGNGKTQWYYWKMIFYALIKYPESFPEAVRLLIYYYHFKKVAVRLTNQAK